MSPITKAFIYAMLACLTGAATQAVQVLVLLSINPMARPSGWAISALAGIAAAGIAAGLPYLKAVLPSMGRISE